MPAQGIALYSTWAAAVAGTLLLTCLVLQEQGMLRLKCPHKPPSAIQPLQLPHARPLGHKNASGMPNSIGSCSQSTTSSFPYLGHDVFLDFCHKVFVPGSAFDLTGPSIVFMHPQDAPAFASIVPKLQHKVVLVSNSNGDQCLPWSHGDNAASWRPYADAILNSSMVAAWYVPWFMMLHN
jgi:hypothetical protein